MSVSEPEDKDLAKDADGGPQETELQRSTVEVETKETEAEEEKRRKIETATETLETQLEVEVEVKKLSADADAGHPQMQNPKNMSESAPKNAEAEVKPAADDGQGTGGGANDGEHHPNPKDAEIMREPHDGQSHMDTEESQNQMDTSAATQGIKTEQDDEAMDANDEAGQDRVRAEMDDDIDEPNLLEYFGDVLPVFLCEISPAKQKFLYKCVLPSMLGNEDDDFILDDDVQQLTDELCRRQERRAKQDAEEKEKQKAESGKWPEVHSALAEKCCADNPARIQALACPKVCNTVRYGFLLAVLSVFRFETDSEVEELQSVSNLMQTWQPVLYDDPVVFSQHGGEASEFGVFDERTSNPTPLKQKSEVEANVTQYALWTSEYSPAHNQSAEEVVDLDQLAQARIGCDITKVPGDGWCFFHAVSRHCSNWNTWSITHAAELYLQALEWLCNQKYGPKAEDVQLACVPFDDRELELHKQYLLRAHKSNPSLAELTDSEIVLLSKLVAVLQKPRALDSIHHGSFVELWALAETFDFHCLIWSQDVDHNLWVRDQAIVSDQEAHARLQEHPQVLELLHRQIGVTGHYDIVDRSASLRPPFPDTTWTLEWKRAGADAVLQRAADTLETPLPPMPPPCEPPQSLPQEHRSRRGSTAELDGEIDKPTTDGVCQGSSRPARRRRTGVRIAQHFQPSCAEHSSCKHETSARCDGAIEQEDHVASHPPTATAATDAQQHTDPRSTVQRGADDVWPQSNAVEESEGTATDVDLDSVLSWDSESSGRSNDADLPAVVEPHKSRVTIEDRAIDSAKHLATHFRLRPLLPCVLSDKDLQKLGSNSGLVYPAVHCAFDGCQWASDVQPCHPHWSKEKVWRIEGTTWSHSARACCGNAATCLWAHLKENHHAVFEEAAHRAAGGSAELAIPSQYVNALLQKEDQQVPQVGWSVDRRTLRRLQKELQETSCEALICACCARIHAGGAAGDIAYLSAAELFGSLSLESFTCNWNLDTYMKQYATSACVRDRFDAHEWSRLLPASLYNGQKIVCCPEDLRCTACDVGNGQLCETCELPICHQCLVQMFDKHVLAVPQALANDNWYGYPTELLYKHKVRWIEAAAASPVWTSVVTYYVEADRGHLVEETLHRAEHRSAVRGNVSSFSLPWEEVLQAFAPQANTSMPWTNLPQKPKVLQALVKITVKGMRHNEAIEWVAGARIRPWVVVALLQHLIDLQHPMCDNHISPEKAKEEVKQRVTNIYGTEETMPLGEGILEDVPVAAPLSSAQSTHKARPTKSSRSRPAAPKQSPPASARHSGQASKPVAEVCPDAKLSKVTVDTASGDHSIVTTDDHSLIMGTRLLPSELSRDPSQSQHALARTTVSTTPTELSVVASNNAQSIARGASIVVAADDNPCIAVAEALQKPCPQACARKPAEQRRRRSMRRRKRRRPQHWMAKLSLEYIDQTSYPKTTQLLTGGSQI
ncbi:unnamed protein product [Durusdinium trenchii]|uniref:DUF6570 domain-containing protein n=1 Tax=Durusdinium trenchii TaxID=1381693 RepID=A0ABP0LL81_9DINO